MTQFDKRRSRWIAFDASFYDDALGVMIRERFGPVGLVLFSAFLCACKRNVTQGRITYGSEADALAQMGLPDLVLTNERGETYTLETFWRALGHHKQTATTRRGRLTYVEATKWAKWQKAWGMQTEAERKASLRASNTQDDPPPEPGRPPDDLPTESADKPPDLDLDLDLDQDQDTDLDSAREEEALERRTTEASRLVAQRRLEERDSAEPVKMPDAWVDKTADGVMPEVRHLAQKHPDASVPELADLFKVNGVKPHAVPKNREDLPGYYRRFAPETKAQ